MQSFRWSDMCIKVVRLHVLPVASVAVVEATLVPSTNNSNAVPLRLNATECQFPSNAVPPVKRTCHDGAIASGLSKSLRRCRVLRLCALGRWLLIELEIATAPPEPKSVPPLKRAKRVKFVLSRLGITASFLLA